MEKQIALYMQKLGISREEAIQLIKDDENDVSVELTAEQKKVAKKMAQGDRKVETAKRTRERKPNDAKRVLINFVKDALLEKGICSFADYAITNPEREISFLYQGEEYKLTLSKPRKEKVIGN